MNDDFEKMVGKTARRAQKKGSDELVFEFTDDTRLTFYHSQCCCEYVFIEDVTGDLDDLVGSPIKLAEAVTEAGQNGGISGDWTFYKFATTKGYVTVRWWGEDNYYSTSVDHRWS